MIKLLPSSADNTIAMEVQGKITQEDAEKINQFVDVQFKDDEPFNIFAVMEDIDGTSFDGIVEGMKMDIKRWNQYNKFAIVSDRNWLSASSKVGNLLPGIKIKHFDTDEQDKAWDWLKE